MAGAVPNAFRPIKIKRAYEPVAHGDGVRILVDRLWPRGLRKEDARFDQWRKDVAPSTQLRQFYDHRPERFAEFRKRYRAELRTVEADAALGEVLGIARRRPVTLVTATRDLPQSGAGVLAEHLDGLARAIPSQRRTRPPRSSA